MNLKKVHRYPFLRMLIPLTAGIICSDGLFFNSNPTYPDWLPAVLAPLWLITLWGIHIATHRYSFRQRWLFGFLLTTGLFLTGFHLTYRSLHHIARTDDSAYTPYVATIRQNPSEKPRTVGFQATMSTPGSNTHSFEAMLYIAKDSNSLQLKQGDRLLVHTRITRPQRYGTPDEFDYPRFLARRGISGTGYVNAKGWKKLPPGPVVRSITTQAEQYRTQVLNYYERLGLTGDKLAVLAALTTGYKEKISEAIRQTYSNSGASHLLAVSGLHAGFIYSLILTLLGITGRAGRHPAIRVCTILVVLWSFALFTGLSASVVRAVIMASLFTLSHAFSRGQCPGNSLLIAAFLMLLVRPLWLFDVGFQLSFCAVAGILLLNRFLISLYQPTNRITRYFWSLTCTSIAAQAGTIPLVCYYFGQLPVHFLLTNLVAIPLATLIVYTTVAMLACFPIPLLAGICASTAGRLTELLNSYLQWITTLPGAVIRSVNLYPIDILTVLLLLAVLVSFIRRKTFRNYLILSTLAICVFGWQVYRQISSRPARSIQFYSLSGTQAIHCVEPDGQSWMLYSSEKADSTRITRQLSRYWSRTGITQVHHITDSLHLPHISFRHNWILFHNTRLLMLSDPPLPLRQKLAVEYLYLSGNFRGTLQQLQQNYVFSHLITDGSMPTSVVNRLKAACREAQIPFTALSETGYLQIIL